jgi:hypothetical protein
MKRKEHKVFNTKRILQLFKGVKLFSFQDLVIGEDASYYTCKFSFITKE